MCDIIKDYAKEYAKRICRRGKGRNVDKAC